MHATRFLPLLTVIALTTLGCGEPPGNGPAVDPEPTPDAGPGPSPDAGTSPDAGGSAGTPPAFYSSFEEAEPQPQWTSTVEVDARGQKRSSGVTGGVDSRPPGSILDRLVEVTASGENAPNETAARLIDGEASTKWLVFANTGWVQFELSQPVVVKRYTLTSANDFSTRDPSSWTLEGSADGTNWTVLDRRSNETFASRFETRAFEVPNTTAFLIYRLNITANLGATSIQLAELQLSDGDNTPRPVTDMKSFVGNGPLASRNSKTGVGFTGTRALRFTGTVPAQGRGYSYNKLFEVDVPVTAKTELSYLLFVDEAVNDPSYPGTYSAVDLAFEDGTYLSELNALDQHHAVLSPAGQGASRTLYAGEWNHKIVRIGEVAAGKRIKRILVGYDQPKGPVAAFGGWLDDIRITDTPGRVTSTHLSDHVSTLRGTHSSSGYSRGNNFPATAIPHGFNFWTPVTDAASLSWVYEYHRRNGVDNRPMLQALALSHEPSPWMGDRQTFQIMPSAALSRPNASRELRALAFQHENEIARPYYYGVRFDEGIRAELAPTDHAAIFRFTFPGDNANLIFDNVNNSGRITLNPATRTLTGYSDARSGLSVGATRLFIYATFDRPVSASGMLPGGGGANVTGYYRFTVPAEDRTVTMRIATSLISLEQARKNLTLEIAETEGFDAVKARAQALWDERLGKIEVEGANEDELTTLYSNLYRLFLYPNSGFENVGTASAPLHAYASPVATPTSATTTTKTGARIVNGKVYVNNGFWDTYRVTWPAYALLAPGRAGELVDGFVQQYKDGGWVARWSSPGYADLMTGTSSDVSFADAYVKGVRNFDAVAAYDAAVKNATVPRDLPGVGRKGLESSIFLGYTATSTGYGLSWAMAGYLNDFGIANMAEALAQQNPDDPRHQEYAESAEYFRERSLGYVNLFDSQTQFFRGRTEAGPFERPASSYDPRVWGYDYTETNGWNTTFDAPYDGQGLAALYGGREGLAAKLDQFFATPEPANLGGSYGTGAIHEMLEARDVRMGQLGLSNQPSFHIPYMYIPAGQPAKTQEKVRDALARLFVGSSIGQGYLGDEDNGAMSAWHLFGALGFYPLAVGSADYVIGSPLFTRATVHLENGRTLVINAPNNSPKNVYVRGLRVNGQEYTKTSLPHTLLAAGATLDFDMSPTPSSWGTRLEDAPPSISAAAPRPMRDVAVASEASAQDGTRTGALFDNTSTTSVKFPAENPTLLYHFASGTPKVAFYTLTSGTGPVDATGWTLSGSTDGVTFTTLDQRSAQGFRWRTQTRAFRIAQPGHYAYYRLELSGAAGLSLAEVELLVRP